MLLTFPVFSFSQSLSLERVKKIKNATVQVSIDSSTYTGTGFYIDDLGTILTCWHVILPAIKQSGPFNKIFVTDVNGKKVEYGILSTFIQDPSTNSDAVIYDFCVLLPIKRVTQKTSFLKLGNFNNVSEGEEIVTCGYPFGLKQQFMSKGIISTKYIDSTLWIIRPNSSVKEFTKRDVALMDITLNPGNSGGAIIKIGKTIAEDEVIGIADFLINPISSVSDALVNQFNSASGVFINGLDNAQTFKLFTEFLKNTSVGVSGCISINYVYKWRDKK